jgi:hypothetical protein
MRRNVLWAIDFQFDSATDGPLSLAYELATSVSQKIGALVRELVVDRLAVAPAAKPPRAAGSSAP